MVEGEGFEPSKAEPADLQSAPFDRSGTPPAISTAETRDCSSFGWSRSNTATASAAFRDDGETQPGAAGRARSRPIDAIEPLGEPRQMFRPDADAGVGDGENALPVGRHPPRQRDRASRGRVADRVGDQVAESTCELVAAA